MFNTLPKSSKVPERMSEDNTKSIPLCSSFIKDLIQNDQYLTLKNHKTRFQILIEEYFTHTHLFPQFDVYQYFQLIHFERSLLF